MAEETREEGRLRRREWVLAIQEPYGSGPATGRWIASYRSMDERRGEFDVPQLETLGSDDPFPPSTLRRDRLARHRQC